MSSCERRWTGSKCRCSLRRQLEIRRLNDPWCFVSKARRIVIPGLIAIDIYIYIKGYRPCRRPPLSYWNPCEELHLLTMSPESLTLRTDALKKQVLCHTYPLQKPALRVHWLVPKQPNNSRNRAQHAFPAQRPESLTLRTDALKKQVLCHTYPLQKPALRVHWLVPKQPNSSRIRAQHAFPAQRPESLTLRTDALKKQVLCHTYPLQKPALRVHWLVPKQPNSSRNRAQHAVPAQRPESLTLRTDALKKQVLCHTYPLQKPALRVHWLVPKQPNSSRNRAQHAFPAQRPESLTLRTDALKKQSFCHTYPLQKPALRVHWLVPKQPNSSRNRAQHAFPAQRPESLTLRTDALKKQVLCRTYPLQEPALRVHFGWVLCHTYPLQKPALRVHWLVPKQPNSSRIRAQHAFPAQRPESLTLRTDALKKQVLCHTYPLQKPALRVHWLVPKQPNSSRNRAQHAFPAQRPESLTLRTDALKKQSFCHTYPLQKPALRVHWLVPKQPNSSRNRAQHAFPAQRPESLTLRTDALKKQVLCHTYPLQEPALRVHFGWVLCHTYPLQEPALRVHWLVPKQPNSSRIRAQHAFPAQRPESLTLRTDALKKQVLCHTYPLQKPALRVHWLVPKQPNSSRNRAQHAFPAQRPESLTLRIDALKKQVCHTYPLQKPALRVHWLVPKQPNSSRNRAQHAFPAQRPESLTLRTDALKKQVLCHTYPLQEPALRVHFGWVLCHTYPLQEPTLRVHFGWFRNSRTAAGIVPNMPNGTESCKWHQPVCHLVPCALADSSGALPLCDAGVGGYTYQSIILNYCIMLYLSIIPFPWNVSQNDFCFCSSECKVIVSICYDYIMWL